MRKLKLYVYPHIHRHIPADSLLRDYEVPFSTRGIAEHCTLVEPEEAEFLYCGQFENNSRWLLDINRFSYFSSNEHKHLFDVEGDIAYNIKPWLPVWLQPCIVTAMNALPEHRDWNVMVRPGYSTLLVDLTKRELQPWQPPVRKGFYFRGQRDPHGLREKVRQALILAEVPHSFTFTDQWNAPTAVGNIAVRSFERESREWSHNLCPGGVGEGMTCRYFEVCGFGRVPVIIARNRLFGEHLIASAFPMIGPDVPVEQLARWLSNIYNGHTFRPEVGNLAADFFEYHIKPYFRDSTAYFIRWMESRGIL